MSQPCLPRNVVVAAATATTAVGDHGNAAAPVVVTVIDALAVTAANASAAATNYIADAAVARCCTFHASPAAAMPLLHLKAHFVLY